MATKYRNGYRTAVSLGKDAAGKRQYLYFDGETADEADFLALEYKTKRKQLENPSSMTLGQAIDNYIESKNNVLSASTVSTYKQTRRVYLKSLCDKPLKALTQEIIQKHFNELAKKLQPKTLKNTHGLLSAALGLYYPSFKLKTTLPTKKRVEILIPDDKQMAVIFGEVRNTDMELPVKLAALMGLRRSEIVGLKWKDIDFENKTITISRAVVKDSNKQWVEKPPKSYKGYRVVPIPEAVIKILKPKKQSGNVTGLNPNMITNRFWHICRNAGAEGITFHALRHYYASKLLALGVPNKYAMDIMGHETDAMLQQVYQHLFKDKEQEVHDTITGHFDAIF